MKRLFSLLCAVVVFAACEQAPIEEQSAIRYEAPYTITVGFEGDDTRIQLNEAQKTVWTEGDQVSVFYKSYDNLKFEFEGNTGDRDGTLKRVGGQHNGQTMDDVVVVYPYSADYMITLSEGCVNAKIPHAQTYLKGSYGVGDNLMIARSSFNQFSLKSVCGWLKIQLTGDGEVIERITFRGNDGEQVAGLVYVDATTAEATLATAKHNSDDNSQLDGTLVLDDSIYTEVTLDCGTGVTLGAEATAFYIAIPPQTFEQGFTVEIEDAEGYVMEQSTDKTLTIERNTIQPMAAFEFINPATPSAPAPASNEIWYTSSDGNVVKLNNTNVFGANITSNEYNNGMGVITFDGDVTSIGNSAFYSCKSLTSVTIPDSVTTIGNYAFEYCSSLTSVNIPDSVTTIGNDAFRNCDSLTSVNIPDSVTTIGVAAFAYCDSLTSVNIPDSVTTIGSSAFNGCKSLKKFKGKFATEDSRSLIVDNTIIAYANASGNTYTIPDSVTKIGSSAFEYCSSLTSVNIPDSVTEIGGYAFRSCTSLTSVNIPDSVTKIGWYAFSGCTSLTSVNIPDSVTTIGNDAFNGCTSLTSVNIPDSITSIGYDAFSGCKSLKSVNIPDSVTSIGWGAFYNCDSLTSVNIPDNVTKIGESAFSYCDSLTSVTIGNSVTTIGESAFYECTSLTSVYCYATIPPSLGDDVFYNKASGRRIYVYEECVELYKSAWSSYKDSIYTNGENCPETTTIQYTTNDGNTITSSKLPIISNIYENGVGTLVVVGKIALIPKDAFSYCKSLTSVNIPDSVTEIGNEAFENCTSLTSVNIPNSVTSIGNYAFSYCKSLTSVNIPDSVTSIGSSAFSNCTSLKSVNIPDGVTDIGNSAFENCTSLKSVTIGNSVMWIGMQAFSYCSSLTSVNIPDSVTEIEWYAFSGCTSLTSVTIGDSVRSIGGQAFTGCYSLTEFKGRYATEDGRSLIVDNTIIAYANASGATYTIPDSVTTIGIFAFASCYSLTSVNIPDSVTTIGDYAFCGCGNLKKVYCYATIPPSLGGDAFSENASGRQIYVYEECVELYKSAWSGYKDSIYTNGENSPETTTIQYTTNDGNTITSSKLPIISNIYENGVGTLVFSGKQITNDAFRDCTSLTSVNIPDSVTEIGEYAFSSCDSLTSVTIPDSVTTIGEGAFRSCTSLTSVTIGDSVTSIGYEAFRYCTSLTSVTIGDSVTLIGNNAFRDCTSLTSVYCKATTPPSLGYYVFDSNGSGRKIYVPAGSVYAYKSATNWSNYADAIVGYNF